MRIPTPEQQAEIDAHWAGVRAGMVEAEPHDFRDDPQQRIRAGRTRAWACLHEAANIYREIEALSATPYTRTEAV